MYKIISGGQIVGYSETIVYIKLHGNGCYVPCAKSEAEGFCIKPAVEIDTETRLVDTVYALTDSGLSGAEPTGEVEEISGTLQIAFIENVFNTIVGSLPVNISAEKALLLRSKIEEAIQALDLPFSDASEIPELYPTLRQTGALVPYRTIIRWTDGGLYMAAQDLWDLESNDPAHHPGGWVKIKYRDGIRVVPETISGAEAFSFGELGWWGDTLYKSIRAGEKTNIHTPAQWPEGWELQG
mgnify:FL=1